MMTSGIHHVGLAVTRLEASATFFTNLLGWDEVRRDPSYPAIFVSDGHIMLTLWQVTDPDNATTFDRHHNVGLHHLAIKIDSEGRLEEIHQMLTKAEGVAIEFAPEALREGPAHHMMCTEPSGLRIEFIWPGQ